MRFTSSIRLRIQIWHTSLLAIIVTGLLTAFYFHEKQILLSKLDQILSAQMIPAMPHFVPIPGIGLPMNRAREEASRRQNSAQTTPPSLQNSSTYGPPSGGQPPSSNYGPPNGGPPNQSSYGPSGGFPSTRSNYGPPRGGPSSGPQFEPPPIPPEWAEHSPPERPQSRKQEYMEQSAPLHQQHSPSVTPPDQQYGPTSAPPNQQLGQRGSMDREAPPTLEEFMQLLIDQNIYIVAWDPSGDEIRRTENTPEERVYPGYDPTPEEDRSRTIDNYREYVHSGKRGYTVIVGQSLDKLNAQLEELRLKLLGLGSITVALGFGIGWLLAGRALRPIRNISSTADRIAHGDLSHRIDTSETDSELGQMVEVLNDTFAKLETAFDQQVRFTADASHELRTPISVVLAKCQFALRRERESDKYKQTLIECEQSAQHLRGLVDSLLQLARVDSGEFSIKKTPNDLGTSVISCAQLLAPLAEEKGIEVEVECPMTMGEFDKERIDQVVTNLISNAIKYTPNDGNIFLKTHYEEDQCVFTIIDNGKGIDREQIPYLFDRFYRGEHERANDRKSTGLGLAIVKAILDAHNGSIAVESALGAGSTFTVRLPRESEES